MAVWLLFGVVHGSKTAVEDIQCSKYFSSVHSPEQLAGA